MSANYENFAVEGSGTTVVHPLGLLLLVVCGLLLLFLPRKHAMWPLVILVCFVSSRQCLAVFGLNLYFMRVIVLFFGFFRVVSRNELFSIRLNGLDWCVIGYGTAYWITGALNFGLLSAETKMRSGHLVDIVGMYFLLRCLIRTEEDLNNVIKELAIISLPLLCFFWLEHSTGRNLFSIFGGVPEITRIREGRLRCQGAFGHPLLAGTIWASFVPLFLYRTLDRSEKARIFYAISFLCACLIAALTASSTPVLGVVVAVTGMMLFPLRFLSKPVLIAIGLAIPILHMVMSGPVWSLIAKINITSGNSAYHRYKLVDGFITHWHEWVLLGSRVGTAHWGYATFDTANQYVAIGVMGGILTLGFFLAIIVQALLSASRVAKQKPLLGWTLVVVISVYCVCFFGISIWGQVSFAWALSLAMIASMQQLLSKSRKVSTVELEHSYYGAPTGR